jgi:hypothetical protein
VLLLRRPLRVSPAEHRDAQGLACLTPLSRPRSTGDEATAQHPAMCPGAAAVKRAGARTRTRGHTRTQVHQAAQRPRNKRPTRPHGRAGEIVGVDSWSGQTVGVVERTKRPIKAPPAGRAPTGNSLRRSRPAPSLVLAMGAGTEQAKNKSPTVEANQSQTSVPEASVGLSTKGPKAGPPVQGGCRWRQTG